MTSIEWLFNYMQRMEYFIGNDLLEAFQEASFINKQEIENSFVASRMVEEFIPLISNGALKYENFEQYYQETFVSKGSDEVELPKQDMDKLDYNLEMTPSEQLKRIADKLKNKVGNDGFMFDVGSTYPPDVDKLGNEDVPKLGYDVREHELLKEMRTMSAKHGFEEHSFFTRETQNQKRLSFYFGARWGYDKAKETLYTEEQVREAICMARNMSGYVTYEYTENEIIQLIKQTKKD